MLDRHRDQDAEKQESDGQRDVNVEDLEGDD